MLSVICWIHMIDDMIQTLYKPLYNCILKRHLDLEVARQLRRVISLPLENYHLTYKCFSRICMYISFSLTTRTVHHSDISIGQHTQVCVSSSLFIGTVHWCDVSLSYPACSHMFASLSPLNMAPIWYFLFLSHTCPAFCWTTDGPDSLALNIQISSGYKIWSTQLDLKPFHNWNIECFMKPDVTDWIFTWL